MFQHLLYQQNIYHVQGSVFMGGNLYGTPTPSEQDLGILYVDGNGDVYVDGNGEPYSEE